MKEKNQIFRRLFLILGIMFAATMPVDAWWDIEWRPAEVIEKSDAVAVAVRESRGPGLEIKKVIWGELKAGDIISFDRPTIPKSTVVEFGLSPRNPNPPIDRKIEQIIFLRRATEEEIESFNEEREEDRKLPPDTWTTAIPSTARAKAVQNHIRLPSEETRHLARRLEEVAGVDINCREAIVTRVLGSTAGRLKEVAGVDINCRKTIVNYVSNLVRLVKISGSEENGIRFNDREYGELLGYLHSPAYDTDPWIRDILTKKFIKASPHSVPFLKEQKVESKFPHVRVRCEEILDQIDDKGKTLEALLDK